MTRIAKSLQLFLGKTIKEDSGDPFFTPRGSQQFVECLPSIQLVIFLWASWANVKSSGLRLWLVVRFGPLGALFPDISFRDEGFPEFI